MSEERNHYIYRWSIDNTPIYFGQGSHNKTSKYRRSRETHILSNGCLSYAENKRRKHLSYFTVDILFDNLTDEEANELEIFLINKYGKKFDRTGILYNMAEGGHINPLLNEAVRNKRLAIFKTKEYRLKQSEANKLKWKDPIYRNRRKSIGYSIGKLKSKPIEFNGVEYSSVRALSKHLGVAYETIRSRIKMGIPLDKKVTYGSR